MSILNFIGNESGFLDENTSAFYEENNELTIIDCGFTVFNKIKKKFDFNKYENINVIITHLHNDHAGSLSQLILYLWFIYQKKVNVICKCKHIKEYLDITGTPTETYQIMEDYRTIHFIKTEHTKYLDAYGFIADINDKKILYTGDTCTLRPFFNYMQNIDELYIDLSKNGGAHIKIDDVLKDLRNIKKKGTNIIPIHLDDKLYIERLIQKI